MCPGYFKRRVRLTDKVAVYRLSTTGPDDKSTTGRDDKSKGETTLYIKPQITVNYILDRAA